MTLDDVIEGVEFAHAHGKRVYLTLNLFSHNKDIDKLPHYLDTVSKVKPDGLIVADPGVFMFVKEHAPDLELHVSTQANVCSWQSVKFWQNLGAQLCVLGREVSFAELAEIREKCQDIKLEAFVHGSMCMTYSGRCLLSNFMAERGANQGACTNTCRWQYKVHMKMKDGTVRELELSEENLELFDFFLEEENRPGELMRIEEDDRGSYILNSRDLCLMPKLDEILELGVDSLKVEGRGKSPYYVGVVARAYRMAMDDWAKDPQNWKPDAYMDELDMVPNRGYTLAFHEGRLTNYAHGYEQTGTIADYEFAGIVREVTDDAFIIEIKTKLVAGDVIEFVSPHLREDVLLRLYEFEDANKGKITDVVQPGQKPVIRVPFSLFHEQSPAFLRENFPVFTVLRKEAALSEEAWARIKHDQEARLMEFGTGNPEKYARRTEELQTAIDANLKTRRSRTPRKGTEGCCGRGCNGCLMFWHDPAYAKARDLLQKKKQGEMLERNMREDLIDMPQPIQKQA
jgi:putative protease